MNEPVSAMVDVAFPLAGSTVPRDHRRLLADALQAVLPWLGSAPGAGVHRVKVVDGLGERALLSQRARLVLRVPREQAAALAPLAGRELALGGDSVRLGDPAPRELLAHHTLYAGFVAAPGDDELGFVAAVDAELQALGVRCERICGRESALDAGARPLPGFSLMLHALSAADALRVLERGIGPHRLLGCGLFVPHRSAAAVGA